MTIILYICIRSLVFCCIHVVLAADIVVFLSQPVQLKILRHPTLVVHLEQELSVLASGSRPLTYQWLKDGHKLSDSNCYEGSNTAALIIRGRDSHLSGHYCCEVKDRFGVTILSNKSEITVGKL